MRQGINSSEMQKKNRKEVFRMLLEQGSMTRSDLAVALSLQKATITNIINDFYTMDIVEVDGDTASGRRGEKIRLKIDDVYFLSIGITRKDYQFSLFTLFGERVVHVYYDFDKRVTFRKILDQLKDQLKTLVEQYGSSRIIEVCLAVPGLFINRPERGEEIFMVSEFEALSEVDIRAELESVLHKKLLMKHDAKLSAYAEWHCAEEIRADERASLAVIRSRGYGIGTGFVVNGAIMNGHLGLAGEVGYMGINFNAGPRGGEHAGTFEYCAGMESVVRYVKERLFEFPHSTLTENCSYRDVLDAYKAADPLAVWAVEKMAWMLGYGIANIIYVVNPDCIIIGNDYPPTEHFLSKVRASIRSCVPAYVEENLIIRYSKLSSDSFLLGGYYYLLERLFREDIFSKISEARAADE